MDCRQLDRNEVAEKYLKGHLDPALQDDFETHILECASCLETVEALQYARDDLAERAHLLRSRPSGQKVWFRWQWLAVVSVLVISGIVISLRSWHTPRGLLAGEHSAPIALSVPAGREHSDSITQSVRPGSHLTSQTFKVLPVIIDFKPISGPVGTPVTITGSGFIGTKKVTFGGVAATSYTVDSGKQITTTVPAGAKTGKIAVTTPGGTTSKGTFKVTT